jgi:hypothetical protein
VFCNNSISIIPLGSTPLSAVALLPDRTLPNLPLLERLNVYDGLMMNARRWDLAEAYQRQRQGYIHQAITQPGIVFGLGVSMVQAEQQVESQYRNGLWIEIQPGLAIDQAGNPIVVDPLTPRKYLVDVAFLETTPEPIYIVISHEPPYRSSQPRQEDTLREWFKLEQLRQPPEDGQRIELCRIQLQSNQLGKPRLKVPHDVFSPGINELDLRFRQPAYLRHQSQAKIAQVIFSTTYEQAAAVDPAISWLSLKSLVQSLPGLYPAMHVEVEDELVDLDSELDAYAMLLITDAAQFLKFGQDDDLEIALANGVGILVESNNAPNITQSLLKKLEDLSGMALQPWHHLLEEAPLRHQPFLFGGLPELPEPLHQVYVGDGVALIEGQLSPAWSLATGQSRSRSQIREAQEFGINLLHFFTQRWQMHQLMKPSSSQLTV